MIYVKFMNKRFRVYLLYVWLVYNGQCWRQKRSERKKKRGKKVERAFNIIVRTFCNAEFSGSMQLYYDFQLECEKNCEKGERERERALRYK